MRKSNTDGLKKAAKNKKKMLLKLRKKQLEN